MTYKDGIYTSPIDFGPEDLVSSTLGDMIDGIVEENGDAKAFSCVLPTGHVSDLTYADFGLYSDAVAAYLREEIGCKDTDVVALMAPNILSYPVIAFGVLKAGLQLTNINPLYTAGEANHQLKDSNAKIMFVVDIFGDKLAEATKGTGVEKVFKLSMVDLYPFLSRKILGFALKYIKKVVPAPTVDFASDFIMIVSKGLKQLEKGVDVEGYRADQEADDTAIYQYTGGTTGRSKGAELTHKNIVSNIAQAFKKSKDSMQGENNTLILILPLYHVYALAVGCMLSMKLGTHIVLVPVPRPISNLKKVFDQFEITQMPGVNTLYLSLLQENWFVENPPKSLNLCLSGAAPLQPSIAKQWKDVTGCEIYEGYGLTESTCMTTTMDFTKPPVEGSVGILLPGTSARIVNSDGENMPFDEVGELWLSGPQIMKGYFNREEVNAEAFVDGWFRTGDVAKFDAEGNLYIVDRIKDMVIVSGFNVYPTDIEAILTQSDLVTDAAVVGVPDAETGEKLIAYIIPASDDVTIDQIIDQCRVKLTGYKVPKVIRFIDEMPKSPVGKVLRRTLRDKAMAEEG